MNSGKYALTCPVCLEPLVELLLDQFPDRIAVRADDHAAFDRRVVGQFRLANDVEIPAREVLGLGCDLGNERFLRFGHGAIQTVCRLPALRRYRTPPLRRLSVAHVDLPVYIVSIGKVRAAMTAAALGAPRSSTRDEPGHARDVGLSPRAAVGRDMPGPGLERRRKRAEGANQRVQALGMTNQPGRMPHHRRHRRGIRMLDFGVAGHRGLGLAGQRLWQRRRRLGRDNHRSCRAGTEHQPFEQRVAGKAVRAVYPGAGHFAGREQARDGRAAGKVGIDAAAQVVRRGAHRQRIAGKGEPGARAGFSDAGETPGRPRRIEVRQGQSTQGRRCARPRAPSPWRPRRAARDPPGGRIAS